MVLPVKQGISAPTVTNIPQKWDKEWFRNFITNYLVNADIRNVSGDGITVSGNVSGNSTTTSSSTTVVVSLTPIANDTVLGNVSGATAVPSEISPTQLTSLINVFTATLKGVVPASGGGTVNFLRADGDWISPLGTIPNNTVLGNVSGSTAVPTALTTTQLTTLINVFSATLTGAVPASGGGTTNFLRADGSFAAVPVPAGANPTATVGLSAVNGTATTFLRSDGAPALSQAIAPSWTGAHAFTKATTMTAPSGGGSALTITGNNTSIALDVISGFTGTQSASDLTVARNGSTANNIGQGASIDLVDTSGGAAATATFLQQSGGQFEMWKTYNNGSSWAQIFKVLTTNALTLNAPTSGTALVVNSIANVPGVSVNDGTSTSILQGNGASGTVVGSSSNHNLNLVANASIKMQITPAGTVQIFTPTSGTAFSVTGFAGANAILAQGAATASNSFGMTIQAGTNASDFAFNIADTTAAHTYFRVRGDGVVLIDPIAVANLPTANTVTKGFMAIVVDANAPTYNGIVAGGGTSVVPVVCDGTNWRSV